MLYLRRFYAKCLNVSTYDRWAVIVIVLAVAIRASLTALGWPLLDSDEGTMGLMGVHIMNYGEHPIFFYDQSYMGATEAYLAAVMFHFFGISSFTLRLGLLLLFTLFIIAMYLLARLLYTKPLALITLIFLAVGSNSILTRELVAVGGDPETLLSGAVIMLLACWIALSSHPARKYSLRSRWARLLAYGCWGLVGGFGLWSHLLVAPFILMGGFIIIMFCWRELLGWAAVGIVMGLLIGAMPLIMYNLSAPPGHDTLTIFWALHRVSRLDLPPFAVLFPLQMKGALLISLPAITGASPLCATSEIHLLNFGDMHAVQCTLLQTAWSVGVMVLWVVAIVMAIKGLWRYVRGSSKMRREHEERQQAIRQFARFSLLTCAAITLVLYVLSPSAVLFPMASTRYLVGLLVTTPALLWPLWSKAYIIKPLVLRFSRVELAMKVASIDIRVRRSILLFAGLVYLLGTFSVFTGVPASSPIDPQQDVYNTQITDQHLDLPATQALNQKETALISTLLHAGITHIYSDYWTCDRIIFQSREHILCNALSDRLTPGHNRYLYYHTTVTADPRASYVFHITSFQHNTFKRRMLTSNRHYQRYLVDNYYVVYKPIAR